VPLASYDGRMAEHNPYAPPEAHDDPKTDERGPRPYVDGDALVVPEAAKLPKRCIKCATKVDLVFVPSPFEYVPTWARLGFGALGALAFRRTVTLSLPFCQSCKLVLEERRKAYGRTALFAILAMFAPGCLALGADRDAKGPLGLLTVAGFVVGLVVLTARRKTALDPYVVRSTLVKDKAAWLLGASPAFVERATRPRKPKAKDADDGS
jgi:hypothetical protein